MSQMELNRLLYEAATAPELDMGLIKELIREGADPLGAYNEDEEYTLDEVFTDGQVRARAERIPKLVELFLQNGMDIETSEWDVLNTLTWIRDEYGIQTLKLFLDHGLSVSYAESFAVELIGDILMFEAGFFDRNTQYNNYTWDYSLEYAAKMVLLIASYEHIFSSSRYIRKIVCAGKEDACLFTRFRNWDDYRCEVCFHKRIIDSQSGTKTLKKYFGEVTIFELATGRKLGNCDLMGYLDMGLPEYQRKTERPME